MGEAVLYKGLIKCHCSGTSIKKKKVKKNNKQKIKQTKENKNK